MNKINIGDFVHVRVNSVIGNLPAVVVRDRTDDEWACRGLRLENERVFEVRYTQTALKHKYSDVCERDILRRTI